MTVVQKKSSTGMKINSKKKNQIFICQITENALKVIKCLVGNGSKGEFTALEIEAIAPDIEDKKITQKLDQVFKKLEYNHNPIVVSLPRSKTTCRCLKVPTQIPKEIEKIVSLQASRYLPYPAGELITGYQILSTDKEGYSVINLVIVHKDVVERYVRIFKELKVATITIALSSYGLANFYDYINPGSAETVIIVDIDSLQAEVAIVNQKKVFFSRYFKINRTEPNWQNLVINEINKTRDVYLKEAFKDAPTKIMVIDARRTYSELVTVMNKQVGLPVEVLSYDKINLSDDYLNKILISDNSFANIVGFGLKAVEESLSLLPQDMKEVTKIFLRRKEQLRLTSLIIGIILMLGLGIAKNLDNKARYLKQLKIELNKIAKEAKPLEEITRRLEFIQNRSEKKLFSSDVLYELHQSIPNQTSLINLSYEEDNELILRGQAPELNSVFIFVSQLEKSAVFKSFNIKVRYATKKRTQTGEVVDFEIVCLKNDKITE